MFNVFLTVISSIFPFLKELILGNQTVRDALTQNKFMVFMGFLFLFVFGANLYMDDANTYLKGQVTALSQQLSAAKQLTPITCPKIDPKIVLSTPALPATVSATTLPTQADMAAKDARIKALEQELSKQHTAHRRPSSTATSTTQPVHDPLDRLYN